MKLHDLVVTSRSVASTSARKEKIVLLVDLLRGLAPDEIAVAVAFLAGELIEGRIGVGPALLRAVAPGSPAAEPTLSVGDVANCFQRVASVFGSGSTATRGRLLNELLSRATAEEQGFLTRLILGELRQGALEGVMVEAIARAAKLPSRSVRRALMLSGRLPEVARAALIEGTSGLARFSIQLFRPIQPMLAETADEVAEVLGRFDRAALEYKLDGARVQVHRSGTDIHVYTRRLNDVTEAVPELVEQVGVLPVREIVLDGEALALKEGGRPQPFQQTMRRFGRRLEVEKMREELPLSAFFFDVLYLDGEALIDRPTRERLLALEDVLPQTLRVPSVQTADTAEASAFLQAALAAGHEGIMAKSLDAPYEAGRRGRNWLKLKPAHTLDLVVLAVEWGSGRRRGWLSNLHLGARDPTTGGFVMLGKTFKGMTDELLEWQTRRLLEIEISRDEWTVYVRPELVVEVAFNDVQESPRYPGGLALRFARVKRYRPDKSASEADTIDAVRRIYLGAG